MAIEICVRQQVEQRGEMRPVENPLQVKPNNIKSKVWDHFDDLHDVKNVFCLLCASQDKQVLYQVSDGNTTSIRNHLESKHKS